jgi:putative peptidoglycan lipid II flippase
LKALKESIYLSIITLLASIVSFCNQILIAKYFGTSADIELFIAVSSLPTFVAGIVSSGFNFNGLPVFVRERQKKDGELEYFTLSTLKIAFFYLFVIFLLLWVFLYYLGNHFYGSLFLKSEVLVVKLITLSTITSLITALQSIGNCYLNARLKFLIPVFLNLLLFVVCIIFTYLFFRQLGILAVATGMFTGSLLCFLITLFVVFKNRPFLKKRIHSNEGVWSLLYSMPVSGVAMLCFSIYQSVDSFWALKIGEANLAYLSYCQRIIIAFGGLIAAGPFTVFVPILTKNFEMGNKSAFFLNIIAILKILLLMLLVATALFSFYSEDLVRFFFERGRFNSNDTQHLASLLSIYLIGMVLMLISSILFRILFITKQFKQASYISFLAALSYFLLSGVLSSYFSVKGIGYAYIISWTVTTFCSLFLIFKHHQDYLLNKSLFKELLGAVIFTCILVFIISKADELYFQLLPLNNFYIRIGYIISMSSLSFFLYFFGLYKLGVGEVKIMLKGIF